MIDDRKYAFYCPKCEKGFYKLPGEYHCQTCGTPLLSLNLSKEDFESLKEEERNLKIREAKKAAREIRRNQLEQMIITTTPIIENHPIQSYLGIVSGEISEGVSALREFSMGFTGILGGRDDSFEECVIRCRKDAVNEMKERALDLGANAVVGVKIDYESFGGFLLVNATGTAVIVE